MENDDLEARVSDWLIMVVISILREELKKRGR